MPIKNTQELYQDWKNEAQGLAPDLTDFNEGSKLDILAGVSSQAISEISRLLLEEFAKTFFDTANGPEVTGGPDDLERLFVDHFGEEFRRPGAAKATGTVTFSRPNTGAGNVTIPAGAIVKTPANAAGGSQRFEVTAQVVMSGLTINASVRAVVAGIGGNVQANQVTEIETALTDPSVTVSNALAFTGGSAIATDAEYREFGKNLIRSLRGATLEAIESTARTVAGVEQAVGREFIQRVIEWDESTMTEIGDSFLIPRVKLYIADANGSASQALINDVQNAIAGVRAAGVRVEVVGATAVNQNFVISLVLNVSGPNYAELSVDPAPILDDFRKYVQDLPVGTDFIRASAKNYLLGIWGPSGSNDLTNLSILTPVGDVSVDDDEKIVPGTITTS